MTKKTITCRLQCCSNSLVKQTQRSALRIGLYLMIVGALVLGGLAFVTRSSPAENLQACRRAVRVLYEKYWQTDLFYPGAEDADYSRILLERAQCLMGNK